MKISELVKQLEDLKTQYGDLDVFLGFEGIFYDIVYSNLNVIQLDKKETVSLVIGDCD
jgi:hypothetical protein